MGVEVIIDDKYETILDVENDGLLGIRFIPPYMIPKGKQANVNIKHLSQVKDIISEYKTKKKDIGTIYKWI